MPKVTCPPVKEGAGQGGGKYLLPPGPHKFMLISHEFGVSNGPKTLGCPNVKLQFECTDVRAGGDPIWLYTRLTFAPSCMWVPFAMLRAFGMEHKEGDEVDFNDALFDSLRKIEVTLVTKQVPGANGFPKNEIASYVVPETPF